MTTPKVYSNFINGEWVRSNSGRTFENLNPADRSDLVGLFQESGPEDADAAIRAAKHADKSWKNTPPPKRGELLYRAATLLQASKEELAKDMTREMGKVLEETRGDVQEAIDMTFYMAGEGRRLFGQTTTSELPNKFCMTVRSPMGVCGLITPWNFPMAIPSWKIMPALICGNTVVLKPATDTPLSSYNLVQVLVEAGLPRGVVNLVTGPGGDVGAHLMQHADVARDFLHRIDGNRPQCFASLRRQLSSTAAWKWAARTSSWCSMTPIWTSPWMARSGRVSGPPANAARRPAAWSCTKASTGISWRGSWSERAP